MSDSGSARGWITDIERFSTRDGPGIRTTVFFQGCPLRCRWCSNPETWAAGPRLYRRDTRCLACGACAAECPRRAIDLARDTPVDRSACAECFVCVGLCPHGALERVGQNVSAEEIVREVLRDRLFYDPAGGATLSGGEPLMQPALLIDLVHALRAERISVVLDTCGIGPPAVLDAVLGELDLVLLDLKHMDDARHCEGTGLGNELVLAAARTVAEAGKLRISMPLIPGFNDDDDNVIATGQFARSLGVDWLDLMPLHTLGAAKYRYLGMRVPFGDLAAETDAVRAARLLQAIGLKVTIGRMM